jgi:hypothetical protein
VKRYNGAKVKRYNGAKVRLQSEKIKDKSKKKSSWIGTPLYEVERGRG